MRKQVKVNLFGKSGQRSVEVTTRGGFPTRHIKVPVEPVPSIFSPVTEAEQQAAALLKPPVSSKNTDPKRSVTAEAALEVLQKMTQDADPKAVDHDWFIIDEILFVATTQFKIRANHTTLLDALRTLYQQEQVVHKTNQFDQHMFKLVEAEKQTDLHTLLAEVDAIMGGTPDA